MPLSKSELDQVPDQSLFSLVIDLYRQKRDARAAIAAIHEDIREVLFYAYVHRPNLAMVEFSRRVGVSRHTIQNLLSHHEGYIRMKSKGINKSAKKANMPNHQYVADVNLELVTIQEALQREKTPERKK